MTDQPALKRAFADYARTLAGRYEIGDVLYRLTDHAVTVLGVDGAGVCIADQDGALQFVTATDEQVSKVEEQQVTTGEGPCQDAYGSGDRVTCADLESETRWPDFRPVALAEGLRAVAGIPMLIGEHRIGAVNLYSLRPHEWPADVLDDAQLLADMASGYVLNARALSEREALAAQLQHALDSRVLIEQAKGIIAERHGIDPAAAFERLRRHARSGGQKLHAVAGEVVDGRLKL